MAKGKFTTLPEIFTNFYRNMVNIEVLKAAVNMGFFEYLKSGFKLIEEIKHAFELKAPTRNLYDFFDELVFLGLLERQGIEETSAYKNTQSTNMLFLKESPKNALNFFNLCKEVQKSFQNLETILKEGHKKDLDLFSEKFCENKDLSRKFLHSMKDVNEKNFELTVSNLPVLKDCKTMIDIGGALGVLAVKVKTSYPEMHCISFDLPFVAEYAKEYLEKEGFLNKIEMSFGDFFKDEWPKTDVSFMGNILHDWDYEKKIFLLKKSYERLNDGGIFVCVEGFIDDKREKSNVAMIISIAMIVRTTGYNMTPSEFDKLAKFVGFKKTEYFNNGVEFCIAFK